MVSAWEMVPPCWDDRDIVGRALAAVTLVKANTATRTKVSAAFEIGDKALRLRSIFSPRRTSGSPGVAPRSWQATASEATRVPEACLAFRSNLSSDGKQGVNSLQALHQLFDDGPWMCAAPSAGPSAIGPPAHPWHRVPEHPQWSPRRAHLNSCHPSRHSSRDCRATRHSGAASLVPERPRSTRRWRVQPDMTWAPGHAWDKIAP